MLSSVPRFCARGGLYTGLGADFLPLALAWALSLSLLHVPDPNPQMGGGQRWVDETLHPDLPEPCVNNGWAGHTEPYPQGWLADPFWLPL